MHTGLEALDGLVEFAFSSMTLSDPRPHVRLVRLIGKSANRQLYNRSMAWVKHTESYSRRSS